MLTPHFLHHSIVSFYRKKGSHEDGPLLTHDPAGERSASARRYCHANRSGIYGGLVGDVIFVTEEELKRMLSERKRDLGLRLSCAKMQMIEIIGNGLIQRRQWGVNHQVMVAGIGFFNAGGRHPHVDQAKAYGQLTRYVGSVGWVDEVNLGIGSGGMSTATSGCGGRIANPHQDALGHHGWRVRNVPLVSQ